MAITPRQSIQSAKPLYYSAFPGLSEYLISDKWKFCFMRLSTTHFHNQKQSDYSTVGNKSAVTLNLCRYRDEMSQPCTIYYTITSKEYSYITIYHHRINYLLNTRVKRARFIQSANIQSLLLCRYYRSLLQCSCKVCKLT